MLNESYKSRLFEMLIIEAIDSELNSYKIFYEWDLMQKLTSFNKYILSFSVRICVMSEYIKSET